MPEKKCTGECIKCHINQQIYCAAQHGHAIMAALPSLFERLDRMANALSKFDAANIINPLEDRAQKGSGAENREPDNK